MKKIESLRETMNMPNPNFPIKVHRINYEQYGKVVFPHHWHEHIEILYVVEGVANFECGSKPIIAKAGDIVVVNSNELHYGVSLSNKLSYYALIADLSLLQSQFVDAAESKFITPISQNRLLLHNYIKDDSAAQRCMMVIVEELSQQQFGYELAIKAELYRLLTILLRNHVATELSQDEYVQRMKNIERFDPVFQYIEEHYSEELSVDLLADMTGLSRFHFSRLFKEISGRTITEYITAIRLDKADYLLRHSSLSITDIAARSGFNDIYYFSRTFKKHKQASPSALRNRALK
ncbi:MULTISPECIES: AraC family transcriptional regulator [unclassified Paenibacillus]|uniref:AraC family transcriptional regulator n=1 Tax=unclassified Paenibacillus TaxID=185978 RepID=UPI002F40E167